MSAIKYTLDRLFEGTIVVQETIADAMVEFADLRSELDTLRAAIKSQDHKYVWVGDEPFTAYDVKMLLKRNEELHRRVGELERGERNVVLRTPSP